MSFLLKVIDKNNRHKNTNQEPISKDVEISSICAERIKPHRNKIIVVIVGTMSRMKKIKEILDLIFI